MVKRHPFLPSKMLVSWQVVKTAPTPQTSSKVSSLWLPTLAWELNEVQPTMLGGLANTWCLLLYDRIPSNVPDKILPFPIFLVAETGQKTWFWPMRCQQNLLEL